MTTDERQEIVLCEISRNSPELHDLMRTAIAAGIPWATIINIILTEALPVAINLIKDLIAQK